MDRRDKCFNLCGVCTWWGEDKRKNNALSNCWFVLQSAFEHSDY